MSRASLGLRAGGRGVLDGAESAGRPDRLRQAVWIVLGIYLSPVLLLIVVLGGLCVGLGWCGRAAGRLIRGGRSEGRGEGAPAPHLATLPAVIRTRR